MNAERGGGRDRQRENVCVMWVCVCVCVYVCVVCGELSSCLALLDGYKVVRLDIRGTVN